MCGYVFILIVDVVVEVGMFKGNLVYYFLIKLVLLDVVLCSW